MSNPSRGEVWWVDLNPTRGHEQRGRRPALVVSVDKFNHGPSYMVVLVPITSTNRRIPFHIEVRPPEGKLDHTSYLQCDQVRCVSRHRLVSLLGPVYEDTLVQVEDRLRILLGL